MSEFTEIMRQAKRLCAAHDGMCSMRNCPLESGEACRLNIDLDGEDNNELERIIMDWAKEHPEPVYPSWEEGWKQLFPDALGTPCPANYGKKHRNNCCSNVLCVNCIQRPMHAEVAEKLGIKPIGRQSKDVHNGCIGCKYEKRSVFEAPCAQCRGWTMMTCDPNRRGVLWEAAK